MIADPTLSRTFSRARLPSRVLRARARGKDELRRDDRDACVLRAPRPGADRTRAHFTSYVLTLTLSANCVQTEFKPKKRRTTKKGNADSEVGKAAATRASGRVKGVATAAKSAADE